MDQTEIFELCENTTKASVPWLQFLNGNRDYLLQMREKFEVQAKCYIFQKDNYDFNSIPYYIIKKNPSWGPKLGQSGRQIMFFKAKDMLRKAKKNHPAILSRWKADEEYRISFGLIDIGEKEIMLYDQIALEKHDYTATKAERIRNSQYWVLSKNAEGPQLPRQQRPDYEAAKRGCQRLQDAYMAETKQLKQTNSSERTNASKSESAIRRKWKLWLRCWSKNRVEMVQRAAGKPAAYFVFVVLIMAEFLMAKLEFMMMAFPKIWRWEVNEIFFEFDRACSFGLPERSTDNSTGGVHRIHIPSVHHEQYSLLTSTNMKCVLVALELNGSRCLSCSIFVRIK